MSDHNHQMKQLTEEDHQLIMLSLGFMLGVSMERKDSDKRIAYLCQRSLEVANKLGCTYGPLKKS